MKDKESKRNDSARGCDPASDLPPPLIRLQCLSAEVAPLFMIAPAFCHFLSFSEPFSRCVSRIIHINQIIQQNHLLESLSYVVHLCFFPLLGCEVVVSNKTSPNSVRKYTVTPSITKLLHQKSVHCALSSSTALVQQLRHTENWGKDLNSHECREGTKMANLY